MRILKLSVVKGPDAPISIMFQGDSLSIGRGTAADLVLNDSQASREHAEIIREGPDFVLVDLGGSNGTLLGEERTKITRHTLRNGDTIRIGRNVLEASIEVSRDEERTEIRPEPDPNVTATLLRPSIPSLVVTVVSGPDRGQVFTPNKDRVEIGRRPGADVRLSDAGISRLHATIRREGNQYSIYDENSTNGIETPDTRQKLAFAQLRDGMVLRLSDTEIEIGVTISRGLAKSPKESGAS